jgi:hypothetical protein
MNCLDASRQRWSAPSQVNIIDGSSYRILELEQVVLQAAASPFLTSMLMLYPLVGLSDLTR